MIKIKLYTFFYIFFLLFSSSLYGIDFEKNNHTLLLESEIFLDTQGLGFKDIKKSTSFYTPTTDHLNFGSVDEKSTLWIRMKFINSTNRPLKRILKFNNPLLESVIMYDGNTTKYEGLYSGKIPRSSRHITFEVTLNPGEKKVIYFEIHHRTTALSLDISLLEPLDFLEKEHQQNIILTALFTIVGVLLLYSVIFYVYSKERVYLYYGLFLFTLLFQQATYLGIAHRFFPYWFLYYDNLTVVVQVNLIMIAAIYFAKNFLQTYKYPMIDKVYDIFLYTALIEMVIVGTPWLYIPEIAIVATLIFLYFNLFAAIYIYKQGYKQARLFIAGWLAQITGLSLIILDSLAIIPIMHKIPYLVMIFTSIEAIILSLSFIDRYNILKKEKESINADLMREYQNRQAIIEKEIFKKTNYLNDLLHNQEILLKELQHRTKNNLQLILSLVRIQSDKVDAMLKQPFQDLENRIRTIAKTHEMFYLKDDIQKINMDEYMQELCSDLVQLSQKEIILDINTHGIYIPIKEASYIGLIVNEVVTNSIKYITLSHIFIAVDLSKEKGEYILVIRDNGGGFDYENLQTQGMGLSLVKTLVENQLDGEMKIQVKNGLIYTIRFRL